MSTTVYRTFPGLVRDGAPVRLSRNTLDMLRLANAYARVFKGKRHHASINILVKYGYLRPDQGCAYCVTRAGVEAWARICAAVGEGEG